MHENWKHVFVSAVTGFIIHGGGVTESQVELHHIKITAAQSSHLTDSDILPKLQKWFMRPLETVAYATPTWQMYFNRSHRLRGDCFIFEQNSQQRLRQINNIRCLRRHPQCFTTSSLQDDILSRDKQYVELWLQNNIGGAERTELGGELFARPNGIAMYGYRMTIIKPHSSPKCRKPIKGFPVTSFICSVFQLSPNCIPDHRTKLTSRVSNASSGFVRRMQSLAVGVACVTFLPADDG
jgi:hypothetical protein